MVQKKDIQPMLFASNDLKFQECRKLDDKVERIRNANKMDKNISSEIVLTRSNHNDSI